MQLDLDSGERRNVNVANAAVRRDFYTVLLADGTRSSDWEQRLGDVEDKVAPALRRAIAAPSLNLSASDRSLLSAWIALQALRGPDSRRMINEAAALELRMQVSMGGIAYLQHAMSAGLGYDVPMEDVEPIWDDITCDEGPEMRLPNDEHLNMLASHYNGVAQQIFDRSWSRIRFSRQGLVVSDAPVTLIPDTESEFPGGGLLGSKTIAVPLDRRTLLWLDLPVGPGQGIDRDLPPNTVRARAHTIAAVLGAERFLYFHPDDDPTKLVVSDVEIPRTTPRRIRMTGPDLVNRDRPLDEVLAQIETHEPDSGGLMANYTWPIPAYRPRSHQRRDGA